MHEQDQDYEHKHDPSSIMSTMPNLNIVISDYHFLPQIKREIRKAKSYASDASKASAEARNNALETQKEVSVAEKIVTDAYDATPASTDFKLAVEALRRLEIAPKRAKKAANEAKAACNEAEKASNRAKASSKMKEAHKAAIEAKRATDEARRARMAALKVLRGTQPALKKALDDAGFKVFSSNKRTKRDLKALWQKFRGTLTFYLLFFATGFALKIPNLLLHYVYL